MLSINVDFESGITSVLVPLTRQLIPFASLDFIPLIYIQPIKSRLNTVTEIIEVSLERMVGNAKIGIGTLLKVSEIIANIEES